MIPPVTSAPAPVTSSQRQTPSTADGARADDAQGKQAAPDAQLTSEEQREVEKLRARDREVRAHEQAHLAAAGQYAKGGATYTYERGPDRRLYAVGGEVSVDTSEVEGDPVATLRKAQTIRRAALAPANPSSQDRAVAAEASRMATEAQAEIVAERTEERSELAGNAADREQDTGMTCPACGAAHAADAHDGMTAYAAQSQDAPTSALIASI